MEWKLPRRCTGGFLAATALAGAALAGPQQPLAQPQSQQQQRPSLLKPSEQKRPTLGEGPASIGPHTASTNDKRKLVSVHSIFIESMDNGLAEKLILSIGKEGVFRIVSDQRDADAVLRGSCLDSPHLKTVHSEVFLTAIDGSSIWQDVVHQPYRPPPLARAIAATADVIADDLEASVREAQQH
jgi:hypothetical protein